MVKRFFIFMLIIFVFSNRAFSWVDPVAQVQRAMAMAEQKLQTLKMVESIREMVKNYQAVKMTYDLAKAGYERATNPDEWKALAEYGKMRLKALATETGDPSQSALFRSVITLDQAADAYIYKSSVYMGAEKFAKDSWESLSEMDNKGGKYLDVATGQTLILKVGDTAQAKQLEWQMAREQMLLAESSSAEIKNETGEFKQKAENLAEERLRLNRIEGFALADLNLAQEAVKNAKDEKAMRKAEAQEAKARDILDDVHRQKLVLSKTMEGLTKEADELSNKIKQKLANLELAFSAMGLEGLANKLVLSAGLSTMGDKDIFVKKTGFAVGVFLLTSLALTILWHGYKMIANNEAGRLPHDVVLGLIAAAVFLTPGQPLFIERIAKDIAIVSDTLEATIFKDQLIKTKEGLFEPYKAMWKEITGFSGGGTLSSDPRVAAEQKKQMSTLGTKGSGFLGTAWNVVMGAEVSFTMVIFQALAQISSYLGLASVIIGMNLRTLAYWVLMIVSPFLIALAPLRWARKTVLPGWGTAVYAVIMWGYIAKILLMLNNSLAADNMALMSQVARGGDWTTVLMGAIQGVLLAVLMFVAPILSYSLAKGSFDGMTMAAGSAMGYAGAAIVRGAYTSGFIGSTMSAGTLNFMGGKMLQYKALQGLGKASFFAGRQIGRMANFLDGSKPRRFDKPQGTMAPFSQIPSFHRNQESNMRRSSPELKRETNV